MLSPFYISVLVVLFGTAAGLIRDYMHFTIDKNWVDAQTYCKQEYRGLAVITSEEEMQRIKGLGNDTYSGWIGLYRRKNDPNIWLWGEGEQSTFFRWNQGEPNNCNGSENCTQMRSGGWNDAACKDTFNFYCYQILVLVKEKKTWEEALDYCRMNYIALASPVSATQVQAAEMEISQTQTDSVWTGLRFLNGKWLWLNKMPLGNLVSLPSCPAAPHHCGARNTKTHVWENRNCNEKLNFLCYY